MYIFCPNRTIPKCTLIAQNCTPIRQNDALIGEIAIDEILKYLCARQ
jgi:hypothetical protein